MVVLGRTVEEVELVEGSVVVLSILVVVGLVVVMNLVVLDERMVVTVLDGDTSVVVVATKQCSCGLLTL